MTGIYITKNDVGTCYRNCTEICTTPELLLGSPNAIRGCLQWQYLIIDGEYKNMSETNFEPSNQVAISLLNHCMQEYCNSEDRDLRGCPYRNVSLPRNITEYPVLEEFEAISGACDAANY